MPLPTYHKNSILGHHGKQRFAVYLICLVLSSFLWLLNSLEKKYTGYISVPVKYTNLPKNKQFSTKLPERLEMFVDATGYTILQYKLSLAFSPVLLNVGEITHNFLESRYISKYTVSTMNYRERIARQISSDLQIININPDSIFFDMSPVITRKVKVQPRLKLSFLKEFTLRKQPFTNPDSVWIYGPKNVLDTVKAVKTKEYVFTDVSQNLRKEISLDLPSGINCKIKKVFLDIPVEQFTEAFFEIPLSVLNVPDTIMIKTFPGKIKISCKVGLSEYGNLNKNNFKAYINFNEKLLSLSKLPVQLGHVPESVLSADFNPKEVEYVLELRK